MKTHINFSFLILALIFATFSTSCNQSNVDPSLVLDEVLIPEGYVQSTEGTTDAITRLDELRLKHPSDQFYYLSRTDLSSPDQVAWMFPQKELKIEFVDYAEKEDGKHSSSVKGLVVKKIRGDWRNESFTIVDQSPSPADGLEAFFYFIQQNLKYPQEAKEAGIQGKVYLEFVVDADGSLTNIKAIKGIGSGCDEEAVRVLQQAPKWNPGLVAGIPSKVKMVLPITYKLG